MLTRTLTRTGSFRRRSGDEDERVFGIHTALESKVPHVLAVQSSYLDVDIAPSLG